MTPSSRLAPPSGAVLWGGALVGLWAMYVLVFVQTGMLGWGAAMASALANVAPLGLLAAVVHHLLKTWVMRWSVLQQAGTHLLLAPIFALAWYAAIIVIQGFQAGRVGGSYAVRPFYTPVVAWQMFQGIAAYTTTVAVCYAIRGGRQAANVAIVAAPPLERYLTRAGDEIVPIAVDDIVSITGAQDYAEVAVRDGSRHLVRMSLGEFERRLDPHRFLRVHRSIIIAFAPPSRAESAGGGRMLAHLSNGDTVQVSRAGAQLLRSLMV